MERSEIIEVRNKIWICAMCKQIARYLTVAMDQACNKRGAKNLGMLVVRVYAFIYVVLNERQVANYRCLVQVLPVSC